MARITEVEPAGVIATRPVSPAPERVRLIGGCMPNGKLIARKICVAGAAGITLSLSSLPAWSAAFALQEQSASRLGTAFAGAASAADDASTMFYNVAGLAYLEHPEVLVVLSGVGLNTKFKDDASARAFGQPLGGEGGDAGSWSAVPSLYAAMPLNE